MQSKAYYKGRTEDFVIFVEDITAVQNWRKDHTLPLAQVMVMGGKYLPHISRCLLSFIHVHYPSSGNIYQPNNENPGGARKAIC
jgi:hypothetical protein